MREWTKEDKAVKAISEIPGVGLLTATAAVASVADSRWASGVGACKGSRTGVEHIHKRRPKNVVIVALANKMARTIWAVLCHDRSYQKDYVSMRPA